MNESPRISAQIISDTDIDLNVGMVNLSSTEKWYNYISYDDFKDNVLGWNILTYEKSY